MKKLISVLAICTTLTSCGKSVENGKDSKKGLSVAGSKGISKHYQKSESLLLYIKGNSFNMVRTALADEADANYLSFTGQRPLVLAAQIGSAEIVEELLRHRADPELADANGNLALFTAIENNQLGAFKAILKHSKNINIISNKNESALTAALKMKNEKMATLLITQGIDINLKDDNGRRAIEIARANNLDKTLDLLIDVAKIHSKGLDDYPIVKAIKNIKMNTLNYITNNFDIKGVLNGSNILSIVLNLEDKVYRSLILKKLLDNGISANGEVGDDEVPVIEAVKLNDQYSLDILREAGADLNKQDNLGVTALAYAARQLNRTLVKELKFHGAQIEYAFMYNDRQYYRSVCNFIPKGRRLSTANKVKAKKIKDDLDC